MHLSSKSLTQDPRGFNEGYAAFDHIAGTLNTKVIYCYMQNKHTRNRIQKRGGSVAEWFRVLDLQSGGSWFAYFHRPLSGFVLTSSTPRLRCVNNELIRLPLVRILNNLRSICNICLFTYSVSN